MTINFPDNITSDSLTVVTSFLDGRDRARFSQTCVAARDSIEQQLKHDFSTIKQIQQVGALDRCEQREENESREEFVKKFYSNYSFRLQLLPARLDGSSDRERLEIIQDIFGYRPTFETRKYHPSNIAKAEQAFKSDSELRFWGRVIKHKAFDETREEIKAFLETTQGLERIEASTKVSSFMRAFLEQNPLIVAQIQNLNLSRAGLTEVPSAIQLFTHLLSLDLSDNNLTKLAPNLFDKLTSLERLDLSFNPITELTPHLLDNLVNLEILDLYHCLITELDPHSLDNLANLRHLALHNNRLTKVPPIGKLTNLSDLFLAGNQITELDPHSLDNVVNLRYLDVSNNQITELDPHLLDNVNLYRFRFSHNQITVVDNRLLANIEDFQLSDCSSDQITFIDSATRPDGLTNHRRPPNHNLAQITKTPVGFKRYDIRPFAAMHFAKKYLTKKICLSGAFLLTAAYVAYQSYYADNS